MSVFPFSRCSLHKVCATVSPIISIGPPFWHVQYSESIVLRIPRPARSISGSFQIHNDSRWPRGWPGDWDVNTAAQFSANLVCRFRNEQTGDSCNFCAKQARITDSLNGALVPFRVRNFRSKNFNFWVPIFNVSIRFDVGILRLK